MFLLNPVVGMLYNMKLSKWHPILFYEAPFAVGQSDKSFTRLRSKGHHTEGFSDREEAVKSATDLSISVAKGSNSCGVYVEKDIPWDGEDIPAMNIVCSTKEGIPVLMCE